MHLGWKHLDIKTQNDPGHRVIEQVVTVSISYKAPPPSCTVGCTHNCFWNGRKWKERLVLLFPRTSLLRAFLQAAIPSRQSQAATPSPLTPDLPSEQSWWPMAWHCSPGIPATPEQRPQPSSSYHTQCCTLGFRQHFFPAPTPHPPRGHSYTSGLLAKPQPTKRIQSVQICKRISKADDTLVTWSDQR